MTLFDLTGKVAIVTGATKGIGKAIAHRMAEHGANVVVSSRKQDACEAVAAEIDGLVGAHRATPIACHISYIEQLQALVDRTRERFGKIDVLVCNAALNPYFGPAKDISDEAYDRIMDANVKSNFRLCNMVLPEMIERRDGSIIVVSSIGGLRGNAVIGVYCLSKAADMQLVRNISAEYGQFNIRANCIAPGLVRTDFARALWEDEDILRAAVEGSAMKRIGEPDEIAGAAVFLASAAGSFVSGQTLIVDGGRLAV